jgi:uncharacterized protein (UPF0332 family)
MNDHEKRELINYRLLKAKDTFQDAKLLFDNKKYNSSVNRLYYSCFYAITTLFIKDGIEAHKHSGVKHLFGEHYILTGKMSKFYGQFYSRLFNKRQSADYDDFIEFSKETVLELLEPADKFLKEVELLVKA